MENSGYCSIREFLEDHCDSFTLDPVGRRVYEDCTGTKVILFDIENTKFEHEGYYVMSNNHSIYSGYDEVRNLDTLFVQNRFDKFGKDIVLAKFTHVEIPELEGSNAETKG